MTEVSTVKVARDLTEIVILSRALTAQAIQAASDRMLPGGYAMVALGPVASPTAHAAWLDDAEETAIAQALRDGRDPRKGPVVDDSDDTWEPPLQLLRFWTERWRTAHDTAHPDVVTIESEVKYIRWVLDWAAGGGEPMFDTAVKDINRVRRQLENLLHAGNRPDRTRVVCDRDACATDPKQLIRIRDARRPAAWACVRCATEVPLDYAGTHCPNPWCHIAAPPRPIWASNPDLDRWKCPACKTRFTDDDYQRAHAKQLRSVGGEKFVLLGEAIATLKAQGRSPASVRQWLKVPEHVADQCSRCRRKYEPDEYPACPRPVVDPRTKQERYDENGDPILCGGILERIWSPSLDDVPEGFCELGSRRRWAWWPDLWRKHLTAQTRKRRAA